MEVATLGNFVLYCDNVLSTFQNISKIRSDWIVVGVRLETPFKITANKFGAI